MRGLVWILVSASLLLAETPAASVEKWTKVLASSPSTEVAAKAHLELAHLYQQQGQWLSEAEHLTELRALTPNDPEYAYQLGIAYRNASRAALVQMQSINPTAARVRQLEAEQLVVTGDFGRAIRRYKDAIAAEPSLRGSHLGLAMLYARMGRTNDALSEIESELKIAPDSVVARQIRTSLQGASRP